MMAHFTAIETKVNESLAKFTKKGVRFRETPFSKKLL
jgi:hypothetical protein